MKTMNENTDGPQEWIDPALEARVVAGILGETSAFEAAELERILAGNPELTIFKRRIEAVNALAGAAIRPEMPKIQLSPGRRQKLLATIGIPPTRPVKKVLAFPSITWLSPHVLQRLAACLIVGGIVVITAGMILHAIGQRAILASSGVADPGFSNSSFFGDLVGFVAGDGNSDLVFSSSVESGQVVAQDGQTISEGSLQFNMPVAAAKPMGAAMNDVAAHADTDLRENVPPPSAPLPPMSVPAAAMLSNGGIVAATAPPPPMTFTAAQPVLMAQAEAQVSELQESLDRKDSVMVRNRELSAAAGVGAGDEPVEMLEKAEALAEPMAESVQVAVEELAETTSEPVQRLEAADEMRALPQEAKAAVSLKVLEDSAKQIPQQQESAQLMAALQTEEEASDRLADVSQLKAMKEVRKSKVRTAGEPLRAGPQTRGDIAEAIAGYETEYGRLPSTAVTENVINQPVFSSRATKVESKFQESDGFINYGSPVVPASDVAITANALDQQILRKESGGLAAAELPADVAAAQGGDRAGQAAVIRQFTGGWGKGSAGGGGGVAGETLSNKREQQDALKQMDDLSGPSGAAVPMAAEQAKKVDSYDGADMDRALEKSKGVDLISGFEVRTKSGQSAAVQVAREPQTPARESGEKLNSLNQRRAATYTGSTTVAGGKLGVTRGAAADLAKQKAEMKSDSTPMLGDIPIAGRLFQPESGKDTLNFQTEIKTAKQPFSTFSLHVSDVSFQLAKDALAKGAMPDPDRIRAEEFYNAFDYNDPSPAPGEEVACRIEQCANPFVQQRDLVRIALKVAAAGRAAGQPLRLTILLDTSGSMEREDRAASVRRALKTLATLLGPNDRVTLIGFARTPRLLAEQVQGSKAGKLVEIAARTPSEGGTNLEQALALASEMALKQFRPAAQNRIVLLTDGAANLGDADPARLARQIEKTRQQGISFDACGVGANGLNDEILEALTRKGDGRYYFINRPEDADAGFARQLAGALRPAAENVKVQVVFNPARVGQYRLIGFEKHLLKKEDFRNDKVQATELSAEEAGVAVYQVQTLPEGEGELGEVFVRFRDPATGQMVERSWTMPYDAKASAFDHASPSMQLAATAALLAERLRGDSQVDLETMAPVITNLRSKYPHQAKVAELIRMYERMRR